MNDWRKDIDDALTSFLTIADLAGKPLSRIDFSVEYLPAPHKQPTYLPKGMMAVYGFWWKDEWLKIGKAGPKSQARYVSQHYTGNAQSTLAGSITKDHRMEFIGNFEQPFLKNWILRNTSRVNILFSEKQPMSLLSLLETFLQARFEPRYEG